MLTTKKLTKYFLKKKENMTQKREEKKSVDTDPERTEVKESENKNFKIVMRYER